MLPAQYLEAVIQDDAFRMDGVKRDIQKMNRLLRSLARNESTTVSNATLKSDVRARDDEEIELADGTWCAFEIKLGANQIDAAADGLLRIRREIEDEPDGNAPAVLCVICGLSNAAYRRADGVFVVPITALSA